MLFPEPTGVPPQDALYHCHEAPVPRLPPLTVKVVLPPIQISLNTTSLEMDVGSVLGVPKSSAIPLQFSSIPLHTISVAPGCIAALASLQSVLSAT